MNDIYENYDQYLTNYPTLTSNSVQAYEYTANAIRKLDQALSSLDFEERDVETILSYLEQDIHPVPFHAYLKRYIYKKAVPDTAFPPSDRMPSPVTCSGSRHIRIVSGRNA